MDPAKSPNNVDLKDKVHTLSASGGRLEDDGLELDGLSSNLSKNPDALAQASLSELNELKGAMQTLNKLSASIATATATLQRLAEPTILHHGLSSLPLEILSLIRVWLHVLESDKVYATPTIGSSYRMPRVVLNRSFPLVCRRFREVELSTPELWTTVTKDMTIERVKLHIARSGDLPLRVQVHLTSYYKRRCSCQCDLWVLLAGHAQRCEWIDVLMWTENGSGLFWHSDGRICFNTFNGIHLSRLRRLNIIANNEAALSALRTWSMPQLSELFCGSPAALFALPISNSLVILKLNLEYSTFNTNHLIDLLSSPAGSNLQTLEIVLQWTKFSDTESTSCAVLPTLRSFRLRLLSDLTNRSLLQRIQAPSIERISVDLRWWNDYDLVDILIEWISSKSNPNLRNVDVQLFGSSWKRKDGNNVYSRIVDAVAVENDSEATPPNIPVVSVKAPDLDW